MSSCSNHPWCAGLPADLHGTFVRQFWRFQYKSKDIKGVKYIGLSKVAGGLLKCASDQELMLSAYQCDVRIG